MAQSEPVELVPTRYQVMVETPREGPSRTLLIHVEPTEVADPADPGGRTWPVKHLRIDEVAAFRVDDLGSVTDHETVYIELTTEPFVLIHALLQGGDLAAVELHLKETSVVPEIAHATFRSRARTLGDGAP